MIKSFLALLICFFCSIGWTQHQLDTNTFEGLKNIIRQSTYYDSVALFKYGKKAIELAKLQKSPSNEALIYQYYGNFYYFSRKLEQAEEYYKKSIETAVKVADSTLINSTKIRLAFILADRDSYLAEKEFFRLLKVSKDNNETKNIIECLNGLGILYENRQNLNEAFDCYLKGLKVAEEFNDDYYIGIILNNLSLVKHYNNQNEEALKDLERALIYAEKTGETRLSLNLHNNLGLVNSSNKDYYEALLHYSKTLEKAKQIGFPTLIGVAHLNISNSYNEIKNHSTALNHVDSALAILTITGEKQFYSKPRFLKAIILREMGKIKQAESFVIEGIAYAQQNEFPQDVASGHRLLSSLYKHQGRFREALESFEKYHELNDSLLSINNQEKIAELLVLYDLDKKEAELENERNKTAILEKENELKQAKIRNVLLMSLFTTILIVIVVYLRHIFITRKQQRHFTQKLIESIDSERSRISRDLHDDIGQSLSVVKSKVNLFNNGKTNALEGMETELGELINQTRNISHQLHPSYLEKIGLIRSVASLLEKIQNSSGVICSYEITHKVEELPLEKKTQIYRVVQECLNNTLKHSSAQAIKVEIGRMEGGKFTLIYRDNGVGIKSESVNEGIGLLTVKERARSLGGEAQMGANQGRGFKLTISF
ncbi:MAG: tetratricopeptide repeat protein [Flavobacteriales bacterium]